MRTYTLADLQSSHLVYLLDVVWCGVTYRFSSQPIDVVQDDGTSLPYSGGLADPDLTEQTDVVGFNVESNSIAVECVFPIDVVQQLRRGRPLDLASAELSAIMVRNGANLQTYEQRYRLFSGNVVQPVIGDPSRPLGYAAFSVERDAAVLPRQIPDPAAVITEQTFPDHDGESAQGKVYPFVFGIPKSKRDTGMGISYTRGSTPAYAVKVLLTGTDMRMLIAGHPVLASSVLVQSYDGSSATISVQQDTDELGRIYSYVQVYDQPVGNTLVMRPKTIDQITAGLFGAAVCHVTTPCGFAEGIDIVLYNTDSTPNFNGDNQAIAIIDPAAPTQPDSLYFHLYNSSHPTVDGTTGKVGRKREQDFYMYVQWDNTAGGLPNPYGTGVLEGGADLCRYMLQQSGVAVDHAAWQAAGALLNTYKFAGYINEPVNPLEWLESQIVAYLPCEIQNGADGLRPVLNLLYMSYYTRPAEITRIIADQDWQQVGALQSVTDPSQIYNVVQMRYAYTVAADDYVYTLTADPDLPAGTNNLLTSQQVESYRTYGRRSTTIETAYIFDRATAGRVVRDLLLRSTSPVMLCDFEAAQHWGWLQLGQVIALDAADLYLSGALCQIVAKEWQPAGVWRFTLHISYDQNLNNRQEP